MRYAPTLDPTRKRVWPCRNDPSAWCGDHSSQQAPEASSGHCRADASFRRALFLRIRRSVGPPRSFPRVACSVCEGDPPRLLPRFRSTIAGGPSAGLLPWLHGPSRCRLPVRFREDGRHPRATPAPFRFPSADGEPNASPQAEPCPAREQVGRGPSVIGQAVLLLLPAAD
jgi:hypothetical protein